MKIDFSKLKIKALRPTEIKDEKGVVIKVQRYYDFKTPLHQLVANLIYRSMPRIEIPSVRIAKIADQMYDGPVEITIDELETIKNFIKSYPEENGGFYPFIVDGILDFIEGHKMDFAKNFKKNK